MAKSIRLAPTADISFAVRIPAKVAPYFEVWFADNKLPTETPSQFLVRVLSPSVIDYVSSKQAKLITLQAEADQKATQAETMQLKAEL